MKNHEKAEKHPPEKVIFMNMCMLCDGDQILALDKTGCNYSGTKESISCEAAADVRKHSWILECDGKRFSFHRRGLLYRIVDKSRLDGFSEEEKGRKERGLCSEDTDEAGDPPQNGIQLSGAANTGLCV